MIYGLTLQLTHAYIIHITGCYTINYIIYIYICFSSLDLLYFMQHCIVDGGIKTLLLAGRSKSILSYTRYKTPQT